ncbi:MAG: Rubrerythrin-2 [Planctomycetes bacterium DG_23]|nr:MAG: Rubrerythrin-2 [Planctomycetes bacterium DG_23]
MHDMTAANLRSAFGGESQAHMRYKLWGEAAEKEGFPNIARLFRAISFAEQVHASNHFTELSKEGGAYLVASMAEFGLGATSENLVRAIEGETYEMDEMYPAYLETAGFQAQKGAVHSFYYALSAEKAHAAMFKRAKEAADAGKDLELGAVQICDVCGFTLEGDIPDKCPICGVNKERFKTFAEQKSRIYRQIISCQGRRNV